MQLTVRTRVPLGCSSVEAVGLTRRRGAVQTRRSLVAKILLYAIVLAVCWSPRIRLGFLPAENVDLRLQDGLIIVALTYLVLAPASAVQPRWDLVWGAWLRWFFIAAVITTLLHMLIAQPVPVLIRVAYLGRTIEMFLLAFAVCGLYLHAGLDHRNIGRVLRLGVWANLAWIGYQAITKTRATLLGEIGDMIESYGPKLIGEPSAFGVGAFLTFAAALTVADYRGNAVARPVALVTLAAIIGSAVLVESRVNLIMTVAMLAFLARRHLRSLLSVPVVTCFLLGGGAAFILWGDRLVGRLSFDAVSESLRVRFGIWQLMADYAEGRYFLGIGPGGLAAEGLLWDEAHNIIVRAWLDFGIVGAILLFVTLGHAARAAVRTASSDQPTGLAWAATFASLTLLGVFVAGMVQDALTAVTSTHLLMVALGVFTAELSQAWARADPDLTRVGAKLVRIPTRHQARPAAAAARPSPHRLPRL